jgi:hypothetical protein
MATIRELFHGVGNWLNKVSMCAGVTKAMLQQKFKNNSTAPKEIEEALKKLGELEQYAVGADKVLNQLKDIVYKKIDPDTGKCC